MKQNLKLVFPRIPNVGQLWVATLYNYSLILLALIGWLLLILPADQPQIIGTYNVYLI